MINRIVIKNYRLFRDLEMSPTAGLNIIVGANESGKSTLLEAIGMALTGRVNGKWIQEELNPYWFNQGVVNEYFDSLNGSSPLPSPEILIELYLSSNYDGLHTMRGVHSSRQEDVPGVSVRIFPSADYAVEFAEYLGNPNRPRVLPVEYYDVEWQDFSAAPLKRRPKELGTSVIDSRTIRSTSGVDYHTREILTDFVEPRERAAISVAHRSARHTITESTLSNVNARIAATAARLHDQDVGLQMDQSSNASWVSSIVPQVGKIPFAMAGEGEQAAIKVALAMNRSAASTSHVLVEEPENHLSHTSLTKLVARIESLAGDRQVFLTTHSSYVLNRLGLDKLHLLHTGQTACFSDLSKATVRYFQRLSGYDTLRLVLASKVVLVEGPSDEMIFERAFRDQHGASPIDLGIDVISMGGVALARSLELCAAIGHKKVVAIRDNDGKDVSHWESKVSGLLQLGLRELFIGNPCDGSTLEQQLLRVNDDGGLRTVLSYDGTLTTLEWMLDNKTEAALRVAEANSSIAYPQYIVDAITFVT